MRFFSFSCCERASNRSGGVRPFMDDAQVLKGRVCAGRFFGCRFRNLLGLAGDMKESGSTSGYKTSRRKKRNSKEMPHELTQPPKHRLTITIR